MHQQLWGYKVEEKLYLGVRERKRLNTAVLDVTRRKLVVVTDVSGQLIGPIFIGQVMEEECREQVYALLRKRWCAFVSQLH
jgi:hypothetical protein